MIRMQTTRQRERRLIEALRAAGYTVSAGNVGGYAHVRVIAPLVATYATPNPTSNRQPITA